ncbi:extracellular solute-binding protein [Pseudomonas sp. JS3066]|jgi:putrescine transport system substrate-binding protein|uniref:extracellular solute-binding protein n=1 Tax=unclassified Pseudomonas TaxID=196821 RepID=UPI000EA96BEE|nr:MULTISPECIES: extracellular solute-binding protein [unclassified Pseudomonas]AYF88458.1 extracellular solute-binding protein [Pseudomonas sp. DY-1]WVK94004.1 extracellular solute-binding protein [Pseudomonas sp. JS3066]
MKKTFCLLLCTLLTAFAQAEEVLRVYNWTNYIDPEVLAAFQRESGIRVEYTTFNTAADLDAALAGSAQYDLVVPSHFQLTRLIGEKRLQSLDFAQLPHYGSLDPALLAMLAGFDSANRYVVPYLWGSVGLVSNPSLAEAALGGALPNSWSLLFDEQQRSRLAGCGLGMLDAPEETLSLWLNYRGRNLSKAGTRQIDQAGKQLLAMQGQFRNLDNDGYVGDLASGKLCVAMAWVGHALTAAEKNPALRFRIPDEGALVFIDSLAIPANAARPDLAYRFIDYLLKPENARRNALASRFYSPMAADSPEMARLAQEQPMLVPDQAERKRLYFLERLKPEQKTHVDALWQQIKAARTAL